MYLVTNRCLNARRRDLAMFGDRPSAVGPDALRLAWAERVDGQWRVELLPEWAGAAAKARWGLRGRQPSSAVVARDLHQRLREADRPLLVYLHGYCADLAAVLGRCERLAATYGVEPLPFCWPSRGGGVLGVPAYLRDKHTAALSAPALSRLIGQLGDYLAELRAAEAPSACPVRVNLLAHSMGCYLLKSALRSGVYRAGERVFDNIVLVAADINHAEHARYLDRLRVRRRVYVVINEDDLALAASATKGGPLQRVRLGQRAVGLTSRELVYVDVTGAAGLEAACSHTYFVGPATERNPRLREFFQVATSGGRAERALPFDPAAGCYRVG